ncbi:Podoplanin, partial [Heterocephalus glaber]
MWTAPVLLWIVGSASLWVPAQAAVFAKLEDNPVTSGATVARGTPGKEDLIPTTSGSEAPRPSPRLTTQVSAESTTGPGVEDVSTLGSSTQNHQKSQTTTTPPMATNTSTGKKTSYPKRVTVTESTQTAVHKDGLSTASLAGIVIGVLITIGFLGGVIFLFVWKMS